MKAVRLRTEYLTEPMGLGTKHPRFFWNCEGGVTQTAYEIRVERDGQPVWETGKVQSSAMTHIRYEGKELSSREHIVWFVRLWDEEDRCGEWAESFFELGLLKASDWKAQWISGNYKYKSGIRRAVDCFRHDFTCPKPVASARLHASALGLYDVFLNGERIEDFILAPGMTDYRKRIQYQTYDVTPLLQGANIIELRLADGWYRGSSAAFGVTEVYGKETSVIAQLEVFFADGTSALICTDNTWRWSNDGPIRFADLKDGEVYNAALSPSYSGYARLFSGKVRAPLVASDNVPVREMERFAPDIRVCPDGTQVYDFKQNLAGYLEFTAKGQPGSQFTLICGELLDANGHVDLSNIQETVPPRRNDPIAMNMKLILGKIVGDPDKTPKQEIVFTCSGGMDHYKTSFSIFGFRYVEVVGSVDLDEVNAIAVYSDMGETGKFSCSNELINKLYANTLWSMKSNYLDLPTDCPTRERLGWSGDAQIFFETGAYLMDTSAFFQKWIRDMEDAQYKNGLIPAVFPYQGMENMYKMSGQSVGWADAVYLIPYQYYLRYGDLELLRRSWPMMRKYAAYLMSHTGLKDKKAAKANPFNAYTYEKGMHLGEWLEPEEFQEHITATNQPNHPEECTAYLAFAMKTMGDIAELLEQPEAEEYRTFASGAKQAYHHLFVETGSLDTNRQAKLVRPLAFDLLDGDDKQFTRQRLKQAVEDYHYCVGTGFLSTPFLLSVLTEAGEVETAYRMLENTQKPGWLGEVVDGATTVWENWDGKGGSHNHYSPGAVCRWLFDTVCGIRPMGERRFMIAPIPGGTLKAASAEYRSLYGTVSVGWKRRSGKTAYFVCIPSNCTALLRLPDGTEQELASGQYTF